jgi:hypothetical protein
MKADQTYQRSAFIRGQNRAWLGSSEMDYDHDKVDDTVLALLYLTICEQDEWGARTWKSHDWDVMDRLSAKGYISDPRSKAKSVVLSPEGLERSRTLFEQFFARKKSAG